LVGIIFLEAIRPKAMAKTFPLAPMSPLIKGVTLVLLLLPIIIPICGLLSRQKDLMKVSLVLIVIYAIIWLWCRPSYFIVSSSHLEIKFPAWCRSIPIRDITHIRVLNYQTFRQEFGTAVRIGTGGLWGGFGWLWTSNRGFLEFYVSRFNNLILIERLTGNNLLITPAHPQEMVHLINHL
jgi:hypothetical protein